MATANSQPAVNTISGKVIVKETGIGIPDILVVIYDLDPNAKPEEDLRQPGSPTGIAPTNVNPFLGDRIGSVLTSDDGSFSLRYNDSEFRISTPSEKRPDLMLRLLAPEEPNTEPKVLFKTFTFRQNSGRIESFIIRLSESLLKENGIALPDDQQVIDSKVFNYKREIGNRKNYNREISVFNKSVLEQDFEEHKKFRNEFVKKIATDYSKVSLSGEFVKDGEDIQEKNSAVANNTIQNANTTILSGKGVPVNLYLSPSDQDRLAEYFLPQNLIFGKAVIPESDIQDLLFRTNSSENPGTLLINNNPIAQFCSQNTSNEDCAQKHTDLLNPEDDEENIEDDDENNGETNNNNVTISNEKLPQYISTLINNMSSPDEVLNPALTKKRADREVIQKNVDDFSLKMGPADVPAFYDFQVLQIAFEHVWKQLVDSEIIQSAQQVNENVKSKYGINLLELSMAYNMNLVSMNSLPQLLEVPPVISSYFDISKEEYNDLEDDLRNRLMHVATTLNAMIFQLPVLKFNDHKLIQELREQGERIIDSIRHDDYYSLHKTLRDLQEKLKSNYEFTVFAADKNYHSVNFGILNTYRQQWTPINYQVGKLVKTIPLSPKEERKYSLKITKSEKRSVKEARKNNSSITNEQSSVSRVEAEIVNKAMNKTNFSLNTEGDYDIYISSGKATTTFGTEAQSESSQNRKDFREAVLKATQEYKEEVSIDVTSEDSSTYEYNESGTIVNPNDELAVTYLFYELQRRYRVSEQLYRVLPVVLVAQEVPSPEEITEAWVIAHDWIINRYLLDDSFRATLQYLSTKSVGDDFAVRELRKNLRQQRNLVETLKLELSIAGEEASNRYKALEKAIEDRISTKIDSDNEGFFTNVAAFFGKDDANPEGAKARELAAKDAHQFAIEKVEKASAALRQEVNSLHNLTNEYNKTLQYHLDNEAKIKRLLVHIKSNILYYMQAIWSMEQPDQRFLRLHKVQVPVLELNEIEFPSGSGNTSSKFYFVDPEVSDDIFREFREKETDADGNVLRYTEKHKAFLQGKLKPLEELDEPYKALVEVADLDTLLGFKGNYMIFPLKEHNALTEMMASPYVDNAFGAMDPDELSNVNLNDYSKYICCLHKHLTEEKFEQLKPELKEWLKKLLSDPLRNGDEIIIPTSSLYIEALPAAEPLLEDFKLKHRALDVYKVQAEVRKAELENLRLAARLINAEREDPDVDKKIIVQGSNVNTDIDVDN